MDNDSYSDIPADLRDGSQYNSDSNSAIIKVIGVGGGGGNAVNYMYNQGIPNVNFVVCNTDKQALDESPVPNKIILGYSITKGRGAGNKPDLGRECAEASVDDIKALFSDQTEMVFITAGMGGGTGTGAAPVVARIAKEAGMLTIGIVTVPFYFEGDKKIIKALDGAEEMRKHTDALLVINNENLIELYKDINLFNAFEKADDTLANAARSISEIITQRCYINVDFQDVKTTLKDSDTAIISTAYGEGEHRITEAIHNALHSPLLKTHDIYTSKRLLLKFTLSKDSKNAMMAGEITEIRQFTAKLPSNIDVKWGIADDPEMGDRVKVTVLASGFDVTLKEGNVKKPSGGETAAEEGPIVFKAGASEADRAEQAATRPDDQARIADIYGTEKVTEQIQATAKIKYAVLKPSQFDDHEVIALIERTPAFNREPRFNEHLERLGNGDIPDTKNHAETDRSGEAKIIF